jgi:hypothetical protein
VLSCLSNHYGSERVCRAACFALINLAAKCTANQVQTNANSQAAVTSSSVLELLTDVSVRITGTWCACFGLASQTSITAGGGIDAILAALTLHKGSEQVARRACFALGNLAADNAANQVH